MVYSLSGWVGEGGGGGQGSGGVEPKGLHLQVCAEATTFSLCVSATKRSEINTTRGLQITGTILMLLLLLLLLVVVVVVVGLVSVNMYNVI